MGAGIKVIAPAVLSNLARGNNSLNCAISGLYNTVQAVLTDKHSDVVMVSVTGEKGHLSETTHSNPAVVVCQNILNLTGRGTTGVELQLSIKIPFDSGLGSLVAATTAAAFALNHLLKKPFEKRALIPLIDQALVQCFPDFSLFHQIGPCVLGGCMVYNRTQQTGTPFQRILMPHGMQICVSIPKFKQRTPEQKSYILWDKGTRSMDFVLPFVLGLQTMNWAFITQTNAMGQDEVDHQSSVYPFYKDFDDLCRIHQASWFQFSGHGPTLFAITANSMIADSIQEGWTDQLETSKIRHKTWISSVCAEGVSLQ